MFKAKINNIDTDTDFERYPFVVARLVNGKFWYWGAWATEKEANKVKNSVENSAVFEFSENI